MKTVVWDVDDVLNDLMRNWFSNAWRPAHPECVLSYDEIRENPPHRVLGVPLQTYLDSLDAFRATEGPKLEPVGEVLEWFRAHGHKARHMALTAVPLRAADISAAWVLRHFGKWIRSFNVIPSPRLDETLPAYDQSKRDFLSWSRRGDIMVDDNVTTINDIQSSGIQTVLWSRPWNGNARSTAEHLHLMTRLIA